MSIRYVFKNGWLCPIVFCDVCGERIDRGKGIAVYKMNNDYTESEEVLFIHKGNCDRALGGRHVFPFSQMLGSAIFDLASNQSPQGTLSILLILFKCDPHVKYYQSRKDVPNCPGIYLLYQADELIYVGQSVQIKKRIYTHSRKFGSIDKIGVIEAGPREHRLALEVAVIALLGPRYNVDWNHALDHAPSRDL
jgi:hypothetical protein